jgi:hypothetical protein
MPAEKVRLRIGNMAKAVLVTGQAYQDPKDALNEFVSNAADEYAEAGRPGERIRIILRRKGRRPAIAVEDAGRGMDADGLRRMARNIFESPKAGDPRTLGEKAIGILAFQQLGGRCDVITRAESSPQTNVLRLERGKAAAVLDRAERRHERQTPGTTVILHDLDPDVLRVLTQRKVVDYLRRRRAAALARGEYRIEVVEGKRAELVTPEEPDGIRLDIPARTTLWGRIEFALYVAPTPDRPRRIAVVGRAGTTIVDDLGEIEEFAGEPWTTDQLSGFVAFDALQQSAGRRAVLRDREAFPLFVDAVKSIEPAVRRTLERVTREVDQQLADRLADTVRRIFGKVLKELADLDNPMRTPFGPLEGEGGLFEEALRPDAREPGETGAPPEAPAVTDLVPPASEPTPVPPEPEGAADRGRAKRLPNLRPDPNPDGVRSRFDPDEGIVYYNETHPDYVLVKSDEGALLDYLSTLVAKEYVVYNNPRVHPEELAEEMVRMLVRVRRHMPRKR